ncbi:MAG: hypothetical protein QOH71_2380 [Blastocatellia bacterium]|nr:hypothetical protein [Blastocatellia bacterium]
MNKFCFTAFLFLTVAILTAPTSMGQVDRIQLSALRLNRRLEFRQTKLSN